MKKEKLMDLLTDKIQEEDKMKVGVIGAGAMGSGIAQVFAQTEGYEVILCDINMEFAENGKKKIADGFKKRVEKGKMEQADADAVLASITPGLKEDCGDCDLIVEAAIENMDIKRETFDALDKICKKECIFTSNTSSLSLTELAACTDREIIGMHFFNPAPVMKLVEVIPGLTATRADIDRVIEITKEIGKEPVEVKDSPGFVVNRILIPMINEAIDLYAQGVATVEGIDTAMKLGANHPMGPLALGDLIGLDVVLAVMNVLYSETGDAKYRPAFLLKQMVRAKKLGMKTKEGFYKYD